MKLFSIFTINFNFDDIGRAQWDVRILRFLDQLFAFHKMFMPA